MATGTITQKSAYGGSISSGTTDHNKLYNRELADQHPISAITNLQETLDKIGVSGVMHFKGVLAGAIPPDPKDYDVGDVIVMQETSKEYILARNRDTGEKYWFELGDEAHYAMKTTTITGMDGIEGGGSLAENRVLTHSIPVGAQIKSLENYKVATDKFGHVVQMQPWELEKTTISRSYVQVADGFKNDKVAYEVGYKEDEEALTLDKITINTKQIYETILTQDNVTVATGTIVDK